MKKLSQKELKKRLERLKELKEEKSKIAKEEKELKEELLKELENSKVDSMKVGDITIGKKVSSYGIHVSILGVKVTEATANLTKELLDRGKTNLLSIKPKTPLLFDLQKNGDEETNSLFENLGIKVVEKHTLEIK